jgi:hypothetical protein
MRLGWGELQPKGTSCDSRTTPMNGRQPNLVSPESLTQISTGGIHCTCGKRDPLLCTREARGSWRRPCYVDLATLWKIIWRREALVAMLSRSSWDLTIASSCQNLGQRYCMRVAVARIGGILRPWRDP